MKITINIFLIGTNLINNDCHNFDLADTFDRIWCIKPGFINKITHFIEWDIKNQISELEHKMGCVNKTPIIPVKQKIFKYKNVYTLKINST